jgi:leucyl-tRNA synthetase
LEFSEKARGVRRKTHQTIAKITSDFEHLHLNTSVAALMELFNELSDFNADPGSASDADVFVVREALEALVIMLAPFAPHVAEEMWEGLGHGNGLLGEVPRWPVADPELARREELEIPIQVNGKLRSRVIVAPGVSEGELRQSALADERVRALINGREIVKVIVVPERLVNVVIR